MALTDNIVSYWKLDEASGNAADAVGSNTLANTDATYAAGLINNAASFNGTSAYLEDTTPSGIPFGTSARTVSLWVNTADTTGALFDSGALTNNNRFALLISGGNFYFSGFDTADLDSGISATGGTWKHYAVTWDGTTVSNYVGGSFINDATPPLNTTSSAIIMGTRTTKAAEFYSGLIDEVGVWSRALTADEISELYNGGAGLQYPFGASATHNLALLGVGT